jgi:hypothetical protein
VPRYGMIFEEIQQRILVDNISGTGSFMSVQLSNMFPQPVTFRTQVAVTVLLYITDVAEVVFIQIEIHALLVAVYIA